MIEWGIVAKAVVGVLILMSMFGGWTKLRAWIIKKRGGSDGV